MTNVEVIHAYRHLLRAGLRAVQFSKPARFTLLDQLRDSFRDPQAPPLEVDRVERTVEFLNAAASEKGLEHRIVKNLIRVEWERRDSGLPWYMMMRRLSRKPPKRQDMIKPTAYNHYRMTVAMLNHSMGLCLR